MPRAATRTFTSRCALGAALACLGLILFAVSSTLHGLQAQEQAQESAKSLAADWSADVVVEAEVPPKQDPDRPDPTTHVFKRDTEGYTCFRIPALLTVPGKKAGDNATVLAFAEGRVKNCNDAGQIDLVVRRSLDGGSEWQSLEVVANGDSLKSPVPMTVGNPVPIFDAVRGRIVLVMTANRGDDSEGRIITRFAHGTRYIFVTTSDDGGATWSEPRNITDTVKSGSWTWYATGPGAGIQMTGKYKGRLVVPCDHVETTNNGFMKYASHVIYSDDGGDTWTLGGEATPFTNEAAVAQIPGSDVLMMNMRSNPGVSRRIVQLSEDGGETWEDHQLDYALPDSGCQGHLLAIPAGTGPFKEGAIAFSNPSNSSAWRVNMTVQVRAAGADNADKVVGGWKTAHTVYASHAAYSSMQLLTDYTLGCLYETGKWAPYDSIALAAVPLEALVG